jgi:hypothetical protein
MTNKVTEAKNRKILLTLYGLLFLSKYPGN